MILRILNISIFLIVMAYPFVSKADTKNPIYINLATDDQAKVVMALDAGRQYAEKGFPIVIYLNDQAVVLGIEGESKNLSKGREALKRVIAGGAVVNICPNCLERYGLLSAKLIVGVTLGNPHLNS